MSDRIPAGAYVIRNKQTRTVLHLVAPEPGERASVHEVVALEQDESQYHNQQIWWVEPLAEVATPEKSQSDAVYLITNLCSGKSLHMEGSPSRNVPCVGKDP